MYNKILMKCGMTISTIKKEREIFFSFISNFPPFQYLDRKYLIFPNMENLILCLNTKKNKNTKGQKSNNRPSIYNQ